MCTRTTMIAATTTERAGTREQQQHTAAETATSESDALSADETEVLTERAHARHVHGDETAGTQVLRSHCKGSAAAFGQRPVSAKVTVAEILQDIPNPFDPLRTDALSWLQECVQAEYTTLTLYAANFRGRYELHCTELFCEEVAVRLFIDGILDEAVQLLTRIGHPATLAEAIEPRANAIRIKALEAAQRQRPVREAPTTATFTPRPQEQLFWGLW
eukprot:m51a1_g7412 hypothetical protein (217) ;mRNA; r:208170-209194